jgi:hypothetical protein
MAKHLRAALSLYDNPSFPGRQVNLSGAADRLVPHKPSLPLREQLLRSAFERGLRSA